MLWLRLRGTESPAVPPATEEGRWLVRDRDAHAWLEVYFEGAGLVHSGKPVLAIICLLTE